MHSTDKANIDFISTFIRNIPDFPKPGIMFKDITPLLGNSEALKLTSHLLCKPFSGVEVDCIIGMESRGFIFGPQMAVELNAGFVPVRKPNKLPFDKIHAEYELEYGTDRIEMHADAILPGQRVVIHDDLIATGGTAGATTELVRRLGGIVIGYSFIIELDFLKGASKLEQNAPVNSLIKVF
ncbi:MAG TPA: adenine phosphoribosyltransferase [Bacteroidetes bacterium]|nr:adenine phosphoribosyltransferase [Bacteroidota bacterium]